MRKRIAVLASHPIEQQGPFFKVLAKEVDLTVFYSWEFGVNGESFDPESNRSIQWDIPLLEGYRYKFLKNLSRRPTSARFFGETNPGIIRELFSGDYDALVVYGWSFCTSWLAYLTAFFLEIPVYIRGENPLNQEMLKSPNLRRLKRVVLGWLFRHAAGFFYIGEENRKFYEYYGVPDRKLHFVPYSVDNSRFMEDSERLRPSRDALREELEIDPDDMVILYLGKLIDKKRPYDLIDAYAKLSAYKALILVGDGPLRRELETYVESNMISGVRFVGFKNQTEIGKYYAMADVFVLPSGMGETWGLVVNEAMCFGLPVVLSSMVGSGPDLVKGNGYTFKMGDTEDLARQLQKLSNPLHRQDLGRRSLELIQKYSYTADVKGMLSAFAVK